MGQYHLIWKRGVGSHFICPFILPAVCPTSLCWQGLTGHSYWGSNSMKFRGLCYGGLQTADFSDSLHCEIFSKQINPRKNLLLIWRHIHLALSFGRSLPIPRSSMFKKKKLLQGKCCGEQMEFESTSLFQCK